MILIKTIIELFDECQIENVVSALAFEPEKIIYIGTKNVMTSKRKKSLENFFRLKKTRVKICYEEVSQYDYNDIKDRLYSILEQNEDCVLDLTGGTELVLVAMGAVCEKLNIPTVQFDIRRGMLIQVNNFQNLPTPRKISLSIEEYIILNGGAVMADSSGKGAFSLSNDFIEDIEKAWAIRKASPEKWNERIYALRALENMGDGFHGISTEIDMRRPDIEKELISQHIDTVAPFVKSGLIQISSRNQHIKLLTHKNKQVYQLLLKIGNIFELYTYAAANEISRRNKDFYSDIGIGVFVDWDGIIHTYNSSIYDTTNEVDVLLIKGGIPIFISCKSGELKKEALYELETVANKFGGKYAKKIIVTSHINHNEDTRQVILQRAKDMNIDIISNADNLDREEFIKLLIKKTK